MSRLSSNYQQFSSRGDPWDRELPSRVTAPDGQLSCSSRAHLRRLRTFNDIALNAPQTVPHGDQPSREDLTVDTDQYLLAGRALPLSVRLAKERNTLVASTVNKQRPALPGQRPASSDQKHDRDRVLRLRVAAAMKSRARRKVTKA